MIKEGEMFFCAQAQETGNEACQKQCGTCITTAEQQRSDIEAIEAIIKQTCGFNPNKGIVGTKGAAELIYAKMNARFLVNQHSKR